MADLVAAFIDICMRYFSGDVTAELENMQKVFRNEVENHKTEMRRREEEINMQQEEVVAVRILNYSGEGLTRFRRIYCLIHFQLQLQVETLKATNVDGKRFQRELQGQIRTLVDERTNLITRIQDQHTEIVALKRPLGAQTAKEEVINCKSDSKGADPETCANSTRELRFVLDFIPTRKRPFQFQFIPPQLLPRR